MADAVQTGGKVRLIGFPRGASPFDYSPFVAKLETYLRLANIPYELRAAMPQKGPKSKLPVLVDTDGTVIDDSQFIIEHLKRTRGDVLDGDLSETERARQQLLRRTFENSVYWLIVQSRWMDEPAWQKVRVHLFGSMPVPVRMLVPSIARRKVRRHLYAHGYGRHSHEELARIADDDLDAIEASLGEQQFFGGDKPRSIDATAYGFLVNLVHPPFDTWLGVKTRKRRRLVDYVERMDRLVRHS